MTKKVFLRMIPAMLLPYLILFSYVVIFNYTDILLFDQIMEKVFDNNALILLGVLFIYCFITSIFSIISFAQSLRGKYDAKSLTKAALIVKLIQLPAYITIFVVGVIFVLSIWMIPFTIILFLIDSLTLILTSLFSLSGIIVSVKNGTFEFKEVILFAILQFIFCADVVSLFIFYKKLKSAETPSSPIEAP